MQIKMSTLYAGPAGVMEAGKIYDIEPALAHSLIQGGYAQAVQQPKAAPEAPAPVEEPPETSALTVDALEKAVKPRTRRKS